MYFASIHIFQSCLSSLMYITYTVVTLTMYTIAISETISVFLRTIWTNLYISEKNWFLLANNLILQFSFNANTSKMKCPREIKFCRSAWFTTAHLPIVMRKF